MSGIYSVHLPHHAHQKLRQSHDNPLHILAQKRRWHWLMCYLLQASAQLQAKPRSHRINIMQHCCPVPAGPLHHSIHSTAKAASPAATRLSCEPSLVPNSHISCPRIHAETSRCQTCTPNQLLQTTSDTMLLRNMIIHRHNRCIHATAYATTTPYAMTASQTVAPENPCALAAPCGISRHVVCPCP